MIARYRTDEMAQLWSDQARYGRWLEIELLVVEALLDQGVIARDDAIACRERAPVIDDAFVVEVLEREEVTNHDVAAFVDVVQARIGAPAGSWIHYGLTSSDVVDTAQCWAMRDALDVIIAAVDELIATTVDLARRHRETIMIGRTHGIHAEPTTFGAKVALWALQLDRDRERLHRAREAIAVMKLSGAVGTYSNIDPEVEIFVGSALALAAVPATQVIARDRHAEFLWACTALGSTIEAIAVELRHLQRTEVGEVLESFGSGQKGSSAMPHKRNPISAENLSGLARVLKGNLQAGLADIALWHERDISHSSVERIVVPDTSTLAHYMTRRLNRLLSNLEIKSGVMLDNLYRLGDLFFSQSVLLALVDAGMTRDDAYRIVQRAAVEAVETQTSLRTQLERDPAVPTELSERFDELFDVLRLVRHAGRTIDALDGLAG
jgi:adenylosuccinate lyase